MKTYIFLFAIALCYSAGVFETHAQDAMVATTALSNCQTQIVTLKSGSLNPPSFSISTNQIVTLNNVYNGGRTPVVSFYFSNGYEIDYFGNAVGTQQTYTGLTNISLSIGASTFTILTPSTNSASVTPVNSVVIPSDAKGPVQIVLESSSDLVNWVPSLPGTYGNTYSNRFFRVRAIAQ